jgi:ABC-type nitrate/sulfonate/bicarbonate transport system ATPase subunit
MFLELESLRVRYARSRDGHAAVDGVSLTMKAGSIGVLIGPSGCGKTSLLRAVAGLERSRRRPHRDRWRRPQRCGARPSSAAGTAPDRHGVPGLCAVSRT